MYYRVIYLFILWKSQDALQKICKLSRDRQTLGGHGHSGGYDLLLFGRPRNLTADIKGWITDYAWLVLKDQQNRNRSIEHRFN